MTCVQCGFNHVKYDMCSGLNHVKYVWHVCSVD